MEEDIEVGQDGVTVERFGDGPLREGPGDDRGQAGHQALTVRPRECLQDSLPAVHHEAVRSVHVEGGASEIDPEARGLHPPAVVEQHQGMPELVHEDTEVLDGE